MYLREKIRIPGDRRNAMNMNKTSSSPAPCVRTKLLPSKIQRILFSSTSLHPQLFSLVSGISQKTASPGGLAVFLMIRGISLLPRQRKRAVEGEDAVADGV
jgi:hypothetical protein